VDPLFLCFNARAALVSGATVEATFGFDARGKGKPLPPFVAAPVGADEASRAPQKALTAAPVTLTDAHASAFALPVSDAPSGVSLAMPTSMDAARGVELGSSVTLKNGTDRALTLLFRPELVGFTVAGPLGTIECASAAKQVAAPIRELFSSIRPRGRADLGVLVSAVCPPGAFDEAGLYRVMAKLDTRNASGRPLGLSTWDDIATSSSPMLLRVRSSRRRGMAPRPTLD
jgi:hypothetical protein